MNCQFCNKEINNKGSLKAHENSCKLNPNRVVKTRSPDAGVKKGNVPWNSGKQTGRPDHWDEKLPDDKVFCENSTVARHVVKGRLKKILDYKCGICGSEPVWLNKPMILILDHINGVNNDNRKQNLRFVCSNCDSQLPTYKARNKRKCA